MFAITWLKTNRFYATKAWVGMSGKIEEKSISQRCLDFFDELKARGILERVVPIIGDELAKRVVDLGYQPRAKAKPVTRASFRKFDENPSYDQDGRDRRTVGAPLCKFVREGLRRVTLLRHIPEVAEIYKRHFGLEFEIHDDALSYGLYQNSKTGSLGTNCILRGDYLLYRGEHRPRQGMSGVVDMAVSRSFVRFFPHVDGRWRFMLLSMKYADEFLAARGWVNDIDKSYICVGQIVSRAADTRFGEFVHGGMSTLAVATDTDSPFTLREGRDPRDKISATPVLTMRAVHDTQPSMARGYLVRCEGAEHLGGSAEESFHARYTSVKDLQSKFSRPGRNDLEPNAAAAELEVATGIPAHVFYQEDSETGGPRGLLVSLPFRDVSPGSGSRAYPLQLPTRRALQAFERDKSRPVGLRVDIEAEDLIVN